MLTSPFFAVGSFGLGVDATDSGPWWLLLVVSVVMDLVWALGVVALARVSRLTRGTCAGMVATAVAIVVALQFLAIAALASGNPG